MGLLGGSLHFRVSENHIFHGFELQNNHTFALVLKLEIFDSVQKSLYFSWEIVLGSPLWASFVVLGDSPP